MDCLLLKYSQFYYLFSQKYYILQDLLKIRYVQKKEL